MVDDADLSAIAAEISESSSAIAAAAGLSASGLSPLGADVNGDGSVTALDLALATRSKGRKLGPGLTLA